MLQTHKQRIINLKNLQKGCISISNKDWKLERLSW